MYMTPFQCNIKDPAPYTIATPVAPVRCDGQPQCWHSPNLFPRTSTCAKALQPMYWKNLERNNIFNPGNNNQLFLFFVLIVNLKDIVHHTTMHHLDTTMELNTKSSPTCQPSPPMPLVTL